MCRLIESIKLENGHFYNLGYHQARMSRALSEIFGYNGKLMLDEVLARIDMPTDGLYKCRVSYTIDRNRPAYSVEVAPYRVPEIRSLQVVTDNEIDYSHKYEDRSRINKLFERRGDCDDVLIVKNGTVTDCSISNIAFKRDGVWYTPAEPLLPGTMRRKLLDHERIVEADIRVEDIKSFERFKPLNAMLAFDAPEVDVSNIVC